ncbi:MAG: hypothetical protein ABI639_10675 [Thermoanaerobaculia bacterium]
MSAMNRHSTVVVRMRSSRSVAGWVVALLLPGALLGITPQWSDRYDSPESLEDVGKVVVAGPAGSVYVAGTSSHRVDESLIVGLRFLARIDASGTRIWERRDPIGISGSWTTDAAVDSQGNLVVLTTEQPFAAIDVDKISPDGVLLWSRRFTPPSGELARAEGIAAGSDGAVVATWFEYNVGETGAVVKISAAGDVEWTRRYAGPGSGATPAAVAVDAAGAIYLAGSATLGDGADFALWKYLPDGTFSWVWTEGSALSFADDRAVGLAIDGDGIVVAGTFAMNSGVGSDLAAARIDSSGQRVWLTTSRNAAGDSDWAFAMSVATDGRVYVSGTSEIAPNHNAPLLAAFGADGSALWSRSFDGGVVANGYFLSVASDGAGNAVAAGYDSDPIVGESFFVASLGRDGNENWTDRFAPVAGMPSGAAAIAVAADDSVVVTGDTWYPRAGGGFDRDLVTVSYRATTLFRDSFEGGDAANWRVALD